MSLKIGSLIFFMKNLNHFSLCSLNSQCCGSKPERNLKFFLFFLRLILILNFFLILSFFFLFFFQVSLIDFPKLTIVFLKVLDIFTKMYFFFFRLEWLIMSMRSVCPSQNPENQCLTKNCRAGFICKHVC